MISSEVQRTLVKSPPELWAELSDPAALARHLGELGEIRIVRTEPERVVEWAAEQTTGVVSIKPSGWGTRVTLSVAREPTATVPAPEAATEVDPEPEPEAESKSESEPEPYIEAETAGERESELAAEPEVAPAPEVAAVELETEPVAAPQRDSRPGFFARLFRRRRHAEPALEAPVGDASQALAGEPSPERLDAFAAVRQVLAPETFAATHPFTAQAADAASATTAVAPGASHSAPDRGGEPEPDAAPQPDGEPSTDIAAELMAAENVTADEVDAAEVTAVLTAVLDRLGAAHHRPFSRG